jgi:heme exporter protein B
MYRHVSALVQKEFLTEIRRKSSVAGIFLYLLSATFVTALAFGNIIDVKGWIALFWIITMFSILNAAGRSFSSESGNSSIYYFTLTGAVQFIIAKLIYNLIMALITSIAGFAVFAVFFGLHTIPIPVFILTIIAGSIGFSSIVSIMSSLSAPSGGSSTLVSVLSFPLMLPVLISVIKASNICVNEGLSLNLLLYLIVLILLAVIVWTLAVILFVYIWKE